MDKTLLTLCKLFMSTPDARRKAVVDTFCRIKEIDAGDATALMQATSTATTVETAAAFLRVLLQTKAASK